MPTLLFRDHIAGLQDAEGGYMIGLLTISGDFAASPVRLNTLVDRSIESRDEIYFPSGFDCTVPDRVSEGEQRRSIVLPVADRTIWDTVRGLSTEIVLVLEFVMSADPHTVEQGPYRMVDVGRSLSADEQTLTLECSYRNVLRDPRPGKKFTPRGFPGMFAKPDFSSLGL